MPDGKPNSWQDAWRHTEDKFDRHIRRIDDRHKDDMSTIQAQFLNQGNAMEAVSRSWKSTEESLTSMRTDMETLATGIRSLLELRTEYYREKGDEDAIARANAKRDAETEKRRRRNMYIAGMVTFAVAVIGWLYYLYKHAQINP